MDRLGYLKEPEHIIKAKLRLAELALDFGAASRAADEAYESVLPLLKKKEEIARCIADAAHALRTMQESEPQ